MTDCAPTEYGPCGGSYFTDEEAVEILTTGCGCKDLDPNEPDDLLLWVSMLAHASRRTFTSTDGQFMGCCSATIRPCAMRCDLTIARRLALNPAGWGAFWPAALDVLPPAIPQFVGTAATPRFVNCWTCTCAGDDCSCNRLETIRLPWLPVRSVLEVKIDGAVLDPASYRLLPGTNVLIRTDGDRWPSCQDQALLDTEPGTWSVTFAHGLDLPPEAKDLVAGFACELARRCKGASCSLPDGVRVVRRPGVEYAVIDPLEYRSEGGTGYMPLDDWIIAMRGGHARTRPRLWSQFTRPTALRG